VRGGPDPGKPGTPETVGGAPGALGGVADAEAEPSGGGGHDEWLVVDAGALAPGGGPPVVRIRLNSRQQVGQRHSSTIDPSAPLKRVRRHPN